MTATVRDYGTTKPQEKAAVGVTTTPAGTIVVVNIHPHEQWLWNNPEALRSVLRGGAQAARGDKHYLGSFAEFIDIDIDD